MKIHDIFREGLLADLRTLGQAAQRDVWGGTTASLGKDPASWKKDLAQAAAGARQSANVVPVADTFAKTWENTARKINDAKGPGEAMDLSEYQRTFAAWLARETKTKPNMAQIEAMITVTDPKLVRDYLIKHFIPQYQRVMTNPIYTIPDGHREKGIFIAGNGKRSEVEYEWDSTLAAFVDPVTGEKAGARQMQSMISSAMEKVTKGSTTPEVDMDDLGRAGATESRTPRRAMLAEGGNVFKDADGNPLTQRINQSDVPATIMWLEQLIGLDLPRERWLGSTGKTPTSGDLDIGIDVNEISKEQMAARLTQWAQSHGQDPKQWIKKAGEVHFRTPIAGDPRRGFVQTDFMFLPNIDWGTFFYNQGEGSAYKGMVRAVLMSSIAKTLGLKVGINGMFDRKTNALISQDPDAVAQAILNKRATRKDLATVEDIYVALARDPNRETKLKDFREYLAQQGLPDPDAPVAENDTHFLARLRDRIVNQGMAMIMEDVRIAHPEDLVFDEGSRGIQRAIAGIENTARDPRQATVKWDGKPAIIFGRKPNGDFVLTDKAGFLAKGYDGLATSPEMIAQIMAGRGGERGELVAIYQKLFPLLRAAVPLDFRGYIQGDLLYASTPSVVNNQYVFQPNTVAYSVPVQSVMGQRIGQSQAGVAVHTTLAAPGDAAQPIQGDSLAKMLKPVSGLLIVDPYLDAPKPIKLDTATINNTKQLATAQGAAIDQLFNPQELRARKITNLPALMKTYINSKVREGNFNNLVGGFGPWIQAKEPAKAPRIFEWATENKEAVAAVFQSFLDITSVKNELVRQLDANSSGVNASIDGVAGHEGYVAYGMKFVNRMRFSAANFARNNPVLT
jgi:hypothetical protein